MERQAVGLSTTFVQPLSRASKCLYVSQTTEKFVGADLSVRRARTYVQSSERQDDGRSATILNVENNELFEDGAFYFHSSLPDSKKHCGGFAHKNLDGLGPDPFEFTQTFFEGLTIGARLNDIADLAVVFGV